MKVIISCFGKFHADFLSEYLLKKGCLEKVFTANPKFRSRVSIGKEYIRYLPLLVIPRVISRLPLLRYIYEVVNWLCLAAFDIWVSTQIKDCDIFAGWSSGCLRSLRAAKKKGIISIVMRTSPHIVYQKDILEQEYRALDIRKSPIFNKIINRELREYDEADYVQVQSRHVFDSFIAKGVDRRKLLHITSGVSLKDFYFMEGTDNKDEFIVLYVGSILVRKGIIYLLEAMKTLHGHKIRLVLIGEAEKEFLEILNRYRKFYTHIGFVGHKELKNYYSRASVFVQPSLSEGLSSAVVEAMSCRLPVIITANTGGCDICRNGKEGFIVPIRNSEAIAERILYLYNNPNIREEMAKNAALKAKEFTWDKCVDRLVKAYESIANGNFQPQENG